jgi:predicted RNA-binding protein (virulence factor B family)
MIQIGQNSQLPVVEISQFGAFLDGGNLGNILLPNRYVPEDAKPGDEINVFIYLDSEDRLVATTETPKAKVGEFAFLTVSDVTQVGAFLDWGLLKDLLVPFREQKQKMQEGQTHLVHVYLDDATKRIVSSAKIERFLDNVSPKYETGEKVDLIIIHQTDLGYKAIVNQTHTGLLYENEIHIPLKPGQQITGYIKQVREDEKIDLSLDPIGYDAITGISADLMALLEEGNGFVPLNDQSSPDEIRAAMGISKKAFKKATGALYKQGKIKFEANGIRKVEH